MTNTIIIQTLLIGSSEAFWLSACFSQMIKVVKTRDTKGLSVITTTLYAAGNVAWMTYFFTEHLWLALAGDLLLFLMTVVTVAYMLGNRKQFYRALGSLVIIGPITSLALITYPHSSGWIGVAFNVISEIPQLIRLVRTKKVTGISEHSMFFVIGAIASTLVYGILVHSWPLIIGCAQGILFTSIILAYYYRYRYVPTKRNKKA